MADLGGGASSASFTATMAAFEVVKKNRDACIHWLLQLAKHIEVHWASDGNEERLGRLTLLRDCFASLAEHKHPDCRELAAL
eukprot:4475114-Prymnesium_polylepis.1